MNSTHSYNLADSIRSSASNPCPSCEATELTCSIQCIEYEYGSGDSEVQLNVEVPVYHCASCDIHTLDYRAEEIKHNALCEHFGVLNPSEIVHLRNYYGMSQSEFARILGIDEASLNRWEKGINIQDYASDRYLRLLQDPNSMARLKKLVAGQLNQTRAQMTEFRFFSLKSALIDRQPEFQLDQSI